jgi:hypothetical protein
MPELKPYTPNLDGYFIPNSVRILSLATFRLIIPSLQMVSGAGKTNKLLREIKTLLGDKVRDYEVDDNGFVIKFDENLIYWSGNTCIIEIVSSIIGDYDSLKFTVNYHKLGMPIDMEVKILDDVYLWTFEYDLTEHYDLIIREHINNTIVGIKKTKIKLYESPCGRYVEYSCDKPYYISDISNETFFID